MKIKKTVSIISGTILIILMTACGNNTAQPVKTTATPKNNIDEILLKNNQTPAPKEKPLDAPSDNTEGIDVDLTVLSATMVYSEVYNMMVSPEEYVGKTVKMSGNFATFINEEDGRYIFGCVITDATACCAQGIEFELTDDYKYPDDYPKDGDSICVTGTFDTYMEDQYKYCTLRNAKLL